MKTSNKHIAPLGMTLLAIMAIGLIFLARSKDASVIEIIFFDFLIFWLIFVSVMSSGWSFTIEANTLIFRNNMLWIFKRKYPLKEITCVKIGKSDKKRTIIYIITVYGGERLYVLESNQLKQLILNLSERGIKVDSYINEIIKSA